MSITVYWSLFDQEWLRAEQPVPLAKRVYDMHIGAPEDFTHPAQCPAITEELCNLYGLKSVYSYNMNLENDKFVYHSYDQDFFNKHVFVRDVNARFISFMQNYIFFTPEDSLNVTFQIPPYMEDKIISQLYCIPGTIDIGKWFRPIDYAVYLRGDSFSIKENDIFSYIKFHTSEKIEFKKFIPTSQMDIFTRAVRSSSLNRSKKHRTLDDYYELFSIKDNVLKEIESNLI